MIVRVLWLTMGLMVGMGVAADTEVAKSQEMMEGDRYVLGRLPPELLPKLEALTDILRRGIQENRITGSEVQEEILRGDYETLLRKLDPEAERLTGEIQGILQAQQSEEKMAFTLGGLMQQLVLHQQRAQGTWP
ncbi:MAG: hypothetical protein ACREI3_06190 [Nitrospirales bacterium]